MNGEGTNSGTTCNHCSGSIEFHPENAGATVECPHCGQKTMIPMTPTSREGEHVENTLDRVAEALGIAVWLLVTAGVLTPIVMATYNVAGAWIPAAIGITLAVQCFILRVVFTSGAEALRLLRDIAESKATGKVAQLTASVKENRCSNCRAPVKPDQSKCPGCGAVFEF